MELLASTNEIMGQAILASTNEIDVAAAIITEIKADPDLGTTGLIADAATAVSQTTATAIAAAARDGVEGTWTDETGANFQLTITG